MKQSPIRCRRKWRRSNGGDDDEIQFNVYEFPILVPNYHSQCIQKTPGERHSHDDDDDVSKKISSNRPVMESNWQKGKFIEHSHSDELVRAFMKCWSLGYLKISTIVRINRLGRYMRGRAHSQLYFDMIASIQYVQSAVHASIGRQRPFSFISFRKHACREFNVPLYVYTILAKHFRSQILFTEWRRSRPNSNTHTHTHRVLLLLLFPLHYVLLLLTRLKYWFLLDRPRHLQPLVFFFYSLRFP